MDGPSKRIADALEGKIPLESLNKAELSAIRFPIYQQACQVLKVNKDRQKAYFASLHPEICDMLKKECRRIYDLRRGVK
jgi:hypothetical protein